MNDTTSNGNGDSMEGVMRRIQKMLAMAADDRGNPAEAANAAKMAENLMRKYQLSHADALRTDMLSKGGDALDHADVRAIMRRDSNPNLKVKKVPGWAGWLAFAIKNLNDCEIRYHWDSDKGYLIRFFGHKSDVQVAAWTFDYLVGITINEIRAWQKVLPRSKMETESFRRGFVLAVCKIVNAAAAEKKAEMNAAVTGRSLMIVKQQAIAEKYGDFKYGSAKSNANILGDAFREGREAGAKVSLRQGIGGSSGSSSGSIGETRRLK